MTSTDQILRYVCLTLCVTVQLSGCQASDRASETGAALEDGRVLAQELVRSEVETFLQEWVRVFEAQDLEAVRAILVDDSRFTWFEDGEARYSSPDAVVAGLSSFPPEQALRTTLSRVRVQDLGSGRAFADMRTNTEVTIGGVVVAAFEGVTTMQLEQGSNGWQVLVAHSSSRRPQSGSGR